jgi:hypothetical protein
VLAIVVPGAMIVGLAFSPTTGVVLAAPVPGTTCPVFPDDNAWHLNVSALPVHPKNAAWKRATHATRTMLHPDFGPPAYGLPFDVVTSSHATTRVRFRYDDESDDVRYPFDAATPIEGGSDRHALMIDRDACVLYELFDARWNDGRPTAGSGAMFRMDGAHANDLRPQGWTSADAAGLPIFPGLVRRDEVDAGAIDHALRFTVSCTSDAYLWPARHAAATGGRSCPPMGARFRLRGGTDLSGFSGDAKVILRAMQQYGLIVADNGSDWYVQGTRDPDWTNRLLDELKRVPARAFVAVDARACRVSADSATFAYGPGCPAP